MQNTNKAQQGQSFIDMVYQGTGGFEGIVDAAVLNGKSITEDITIGENILVGETTNNSIKNILQRKNPATAIQHKEARTKKLEGIDYWVIQSDFIIS